MGGSIISTQKRSSPKKRAILNGKATGENHEVPAKSVHEQITKSITIQRKNWVNPFETDNDKSMKIARFFVSSTFKDFKCEREFLIKKIFPELAEFCEARKIAFYECDLRWGIPKDSTGTQVIDTCLDTLEQCHRETGGSPFFISFLGSRYGWVPTPPDLTDLQKEKHNWVDETSITHMEVVRGALAPSNRNALFFIRSAESLQTLRETSEFEDFVEVKESERMKLENLKTEISNLFPHNQVIHYKPKVSFSEENEEVIIEDFGEICAATIKFFKSRVEETFVPDLRSETWEACEDMHATLKFIAKDVVSRSRELEDLLHFLQNPETSLPVLTNEDCYEELTQMTQNKTLESDTLEVEKHNNIILVQGESGIGKSALLAKLATNLFQQNEQVDLITHFVSLNTDGQSQKCFLINAIRQFNDILGQSEKPSMEQLLMVAESDLLETFKKLYTVAKERSKPMVIMVDGIDLFDAFEQKGPNFLTWVPDVMSNDCNIRLVLSAANGSLAVRKLVDRKLRAYNLYPFSTEEACNVIQTNLGNFHKRLDNSQLECLLKKKNCFKPNWLRLACYELIVFGSFEKLSEKIESLPEEFEELLSCVMKRIVREDPTNLIKKALTFLFYAKVGLTEKNLRCLLGDMTTNSLLNAKNFDIVVRSVNHFIFRVKRGCSIVFKFRNQNYLSAVTPLLNEDEAVDYRQELVKLFRDNDSIPLADERLVQLEVSYQLTKLEKYAELTNFLKKHKIGKKTHFVEKSRWLKEIRCKRQCFLNKLAETQLFICGFCKNGMNGMGQVCCPNLDCCVICSGRLSGLKFGGEENAWFCSAHRTFPGGDKCFVCKRVLMPNMEKVPVRTCMWCRGFPNQCCYLP